MSERTPPGGPRVPGWAPALPAPDLGPVPALPPGGPFPALPAPVPRPVPQPGPQKGPRSRGFAIAAVAFVVVAGGFFAYYAANQDRIDSEILDSTRVTMEERMIERYDIGRYGGDHAHAALVVFIGSGSIDFGLPAFQLQSRYIHFEDGNPYQVHRHAERAPLELLFASLGIKTGGGCITFRGESFCEEPGLSLRYFVNGRETGPVSGRVIEHGDRILVFYGDDSLVPGQLRHLESLAISDLPRRDQVRQDGEILV